MDEDTSLGMLRRQNITIDGNSPSLIHAHLRIARHAIDHGSQLGTKQKNVDTTKGGDVIEGFDDGLLENAGVQVADKLALDVDDGTALCKTSGSAQDTAE